MKLCRLLFGLGVLLLPLSAQARLFFLGSQPYLSIIAFPQDLQLIPGEYVSYGASYQSMPWWGDVDEPARKPNDTYTATAEDFMFGRQAGEPQTSWFSNDFGINTLGTQVEWLAQAAPKLKTLVGVNYASNIMAGHAQGDLRATDPSLTFIPFEYKVLHHLYSWGVKGIVAGELFGHPAGVKVQFSDAGSYLLDSEFTATVNGERFTSDRLLWGWSRAACNHIFGVRGINGDAWFQDSYSQGMEYRFDLQAGLTLPNLKLGNHFRYQGSLKDQYAWVHDPAATTQTAAGNFAGRYEKQRWSDDGGVLTDRLYANVTWDRGAMYAVNTLFFLGLDARGVRNALHDNLAVTNHQEETSYSWVVEANPNVNLALGKFLTLDAALLNEFSYSRYDHTFERWNGRIGGGERRPWDTEVYPGEEYVWEQFSNANEYFYDAGLELDFTLPLYKDAGSTLGLFTALFFNSKFTYLYKYYGTNSDGGFQAENRRYNFRREFWMNSMFSFFYRREKEKFGVRFDIVEPLLYSLSLTTEVAEPDGKNVLYRSERSAQWATQEGVKLMLTVYQEL